MCLPKCLSTGGTRSHATVAGKLVCEQKSYLFVMYTLSVPCGCVFTATSNTAINYSEVPLTFS